MAKTNAKKSRASVFGTVLYILLLAVEIVLLAAVGLYIIRQEQFGKFSTSVNIR